MTNTIKTLTVIAIMTAILTTTYLNGVARDKFGTKTHQGEIHLPEMAASNELTAGQVLATEGTGFEPALHCCKQHFQCCAFNHSATPPGVGEW